MSESTLERWEKAYKKEYPNWTTGIWDGGPDENSAGVDCYPSYSSTQRRENPLSLVVSFSIELDQTKLNVEKMIEFVLFLSSLNDYCTYSSVESGGYSFPEIITKENGYDEVYKKVFPDRVSCGWMLFVPAIILAELIPEAARVVPVIKENKQIGTIIVSTEEIFDGNNKDHIGKANDIEIKLLDLGLLPLMTELQSWRPGELITQWRETDLQFIQRILSEVGIYWRTEMDDTRELDTFIFADSQQNYRFDVHLPYREPSGLFDGAAESVWDVRTWHTLPARIENREKNDIYAYLDEQGHYRVKLDFDREGTAPGFGYLWLLMARPFPRSSP